MAEGFPCFGLEALGQCLYEAGKPGIVYFTIGDAIAALSVTLLIPQFIKPIYRFRLQCVGVRMHWIYALVFSGAALVIIAAFLPNLPLPRDMLLFYPVVWEIVAALLFVLAYGLLAWTIVRRAVVATGRVERFLWSAGTILSEGGEKDVVEFAEDLASTLPRLLRMSAFFLSHTKESAFFDFAYAKQLRDGSFAHYLLRIISDKRFCEVLVTHSPWLAAHMLDTIRRAEISSKSIDSFVQELALYAITSEASMLTREVGYTGFRTAPVLSDALFSNHRFNKRYRPFLSIETYDGDIVSEAFVRRLNTAAKLTIEAMFESDDIDGPQNIMSVKGAYVRLFRQLRSLSAKKTLDVGASVSAHFAIRDIIKLTREYINSLPGEDKRLLYLDAESRRDFHAISEIAKLVFEVLCAIANDFEGPNEDFWSFSLDVMDASFPRYGEQPVGMDPFQQRLALLLLEKMKENMEGLYPAISRILIAVIGPYPESGLSPRSARALLCDGVYRHLQNLKSVHLHRLGMRDDYLPKNVSYDFATDTLFFKYWGGAVGTVVLSEIAPPEVSLAPEDLPA